MTLWMPIDSFTIPTRAPLRLVPMPRLYRRLLHRCRTVNEVNRLHISLEKRMTPSEFSSLTGATPLRLRRLLARAVEQWERLTSPIPSASRHKWIARIEGQLARSGSRAPELYVRYRPGPYMEFYSNPEVLAPKTLLICFKGNAQRLLMPVATFLQHLPAARYDVLTLMDPLKRAYVDGLPGVSNGFSGVARTIGRFLEKTAYRSVVSFGTSAGGLPALILTARLGLDKGVSVGAGGWPEEDPASAPLVPLLVDCNTDSNLLMIYGLDFDRDRKAAESLARVTPLRTLGVTSKTRRIGHNPLHAALVEEKLARFLDAALDPAVEGFSDHGGPHAGVYEL